MIKQFTATTYIIDERLRKVLLIFHKKLKKWLPCGGHIDPNETPTEAAKREALEETGFHIEIIKQENVWIEKWNAKSFERPYLCLLEEIPAFGEMPSHQHMDFIYLARPIAGEKILNTKETEGIRWFSEEEIKSLKPDDEIFGETQDFLEHLFSTYRFELEYCLDNI